MKRSVSRQSGKRALHCARALPPRDYPWKVLDNLVHDLSDSLLEDELEMVRGVIRSRDNARYLELSEAWGPQSMIPNGISEDRFFARYQIASLLKKYRFPTDKSSRRESATQKFLKAEEQCGTFNRNDYWHLIAQNDEQGLSVYTHMLHFLRSLLGDFPPSREELTEWSRHGPGANLDTVDGRTSLYEKYHNWPYSCTKEALGLARLSIEDDERWLGALEEDYRIKHGVEPWRILDRDTFWSNVLHVVPGNRIAFVPKNCLTDRTIAIEPCMNLYLQLGVDGYIRRRLKRWGVDLDSQLKNQELARRGSECWQMPNPFVTLDLAAASDTVSLKLCEHVLPPAWYSYLMKIRSPIGELDGEVISYEKISSMGNGFTFALESAIFASIVYGVQKTLEGSFDPDEFAVYGDDIIVRAAHSGLVIQTLNLCGFSLNKEKSFVEGPFRESCGADWFSGHPVRPVFLNEKPSTVMELFCDSNRLRRILSLRSWGFEFETTKFIEKLIPENLKYFGPVSNELFDSYIHSPYPTVGYRRGMYRFPTLQVHSKSRKGDGFLFRKLMHTLREAPVPIQRWMKGTGKGSRFALTVAIPSLASETYMYTSNWCASYNE